MFDQSQETGIVMFLGQQIIQQFAKYVLASFWRFFQFFDEQNYAAKRKELTWIKFPIKRWCHFEILLKTAKKHEYLVSKFAFRRNKVIHNDHRHLFTCLFKCFLWSGRPLIIEGLRTKDFHISTYNFWLFWRMLPPKIGNHMFLFVLVLFKSR